MPILTCGALAVDLEGACVRLNGADVPVTFQEFKLLVRLIRRKARVVSREELIARAWSPGDPVSPRTVDVHIRRLRRKLDDPQGSLIETVYQRGYRLAATHSA